MMKNLMLAFRPFYNKFAVLLSKHKTLTLPEK